MRVASAARLAAPRLIGLLAAAAAVAAGFLLFPGCSRCCERPCGDVAPTAARTPSPAPVVAVAKAPPSTVVAPTPTAAGDVLAASRIHNYRRLSPSLASGASPETEADFDALKAAGFTSIVTVDGARPDVEAARKRGIRYVHVPIGYDGIPEARALELAKTFETLAPSGPIFVHCHHGKHRGPTACAIARIVLDHLDGEHAVEEMKRAGTDPKYRGLYDVIRGFQAPDAARLASVTAPMPETVPPPAMQASMVAIDAAWENLKAVRRAGWKKSAEHPDVDPPHEATILAEHFREAARHADVAKESEGFRTQLKTSEDAAWALAAALGDRLDVPAAEKAFDAGASSCTACHAAHRDNTHRR